MTILLRRQSTVAGVYILVLILVGIIVWHGASSRSARIEEEKREVSETEEKKIPERKKEVMVSLMAPEKPTPKQKVEPPTQTPAKRAKTAAAPKTIKPAAATAAAALSRKKETPAKATPAPKAAKSQPTVDKFPQIVAQHQRPGFPGVSACFSPSWEPDLYWQHGSKKSPRGRLSRGWRTTRSRLARRIGRRAGAHCG